MSDKPEKIYLNGCFVREHVFPDGNPLLNQAINMTTANAMAQAYGVKKVDRDGNEYIELRLVIGKRKMVSAGGVTHWVALDTYKPKQQDAPADDAPAETVDAAEKPDLPF